ncbi:MAG: cytochrome c biogenesis protein ResB, partial [Fibrobacteres bacterium]|nr:cytochrome c biogenesis protein ResB [Fibrobacterota bacterium]
MSKRLLPAKILTVAADLRITLCLFGFVALLSIVAVVIPNGDKLFHSTLFKIVLLLVSVNLISCLLKRVGHNFIRSVTFKVPNYPFEWSSYNIIHEEEITDSEDWQSGKLNSLLKQSGLTVRTSSSDSILLIAARKGTAGLLGSTLLHVGVLILGIAAWVSYTRDTSSFIDLAPGEKFALEGASSTVGLDSFVVRLTDNGAVKSFQSYVSIYRSGSFIGSDLIEVNKPLNVDGWFLYQNSYGEVSDNFKIAMVAVKSVEGTFDTVINAEMGTPVKLDMGISLIIDRFFCSFLIDRNSNRVVNRSHEHDNPAFDYHLVDSLGNEIQSGWSFPLHPEFHGMGGAEEYHVSVNDYLPSYYTTLQVRRHTGGNVLIFTMILNSLVILSVFYIPRHIMMIELAGTKINNGVKS